MSLSLVLLIGSTLSLIAGSALLWIGRRGRLIDDHPYCRDCGFDLFGLPESADRCPECGSFLIDAHGCRRAEAVRVGRRARRSAMLAWGLALTLPSALWLGSIGLSVVGGVDVEQY
jgi:hypothetical protein